MNEALWDVAGGAVGGEDDIGGAGDGESRVLTSWGPPDGGTTSGVENTKGKQMISLVLDGMDQNKIFLYS